MAANEVSSYAAGLRDALSAAADAQLQAQLAELVSAAEELDAALAGGPVSLGEAQARWVAARDDIVAELTGFLLGVLAEIPGLATLASDLGDVATSGIHGDVDLGPVPPVGGLVDPGRAAAARWLMARSPPPIPIGPFQIGEIAASLSSPFGGGRAARRRVDRAAARRRRVRRHAGAAARPGADQRRRGARDDRRPAVVPGDPRASRSFRPIQLSFGFSLDRVGRHRRDQPPRRHGCAARRRPHRDRRRRPLRHPTPGLAAGAGHRRRPSLPGQPGHPPGRPVAAPVVAVVRPGRQPASPSTSAWSSRSPPARS